MNVLEMHIAWKQGMDKIHGERDDQFLPQEIDIELNRAMQRFIDQRYGKNNIYQEGFEQSQKRIDELRSLVVEYEGPVTFKEEVYTNRVWADSFQLPNDYMYLVNQRSKIRLDRCKPVSFTYEGLSTIFYFTFNLQNFLVQDLSFLSEIRMVGIGGQQVLVWEPSPQLEQAGYLPQQFPENITSVANDMMANAATGISIHWQQYGNLDFPGQFIVIVDLDTHPWVSSTTVLQAVDDQNNVVNSLPILEQDRSNIQRRVISGNSSVENVLNRFSQQDDIYRLLNDPFNTTFEKEPLTTIRDSFIDVYTSSIFIIESVKITYIRKPLPISISLGYDCELPEHTHQTIVDMAVASGLERTSDPRYKTQGGELLNRE